MLQSSFLTDLLATITNRAQHAQAARDTRPTEELCRLLLSDIGDVSAIKVARAILQKYRGMDPGQRANFFRHLADDFDIDPDRVAMLAQRYGTSRSTEDLAALTRHAEPKRQEILRRLNRVPGATADLVAMRCDLFEAMRADPGLARIDLDFAHLFASWFNPGFLVLRRINWNSPANILEKIIAYEAVHAIDSWDALRLRLLPEDRRCFAYFHPAMPEEPLIFVEVALTSGIPGNIQLGAGRGPRHYPAHRMDTAVFYSISNCQAGLRGISFGNALIKHVVEDLSVSLPQLKTFVTLSPIPGFRALGRRSAGGAARGRGGHFTRRAVHDRRRQGHANPAPLHRALPRERKRPRRRSGQPGRALSSGQRGDHSGCASGRRQVRQRAADGLWRDGELPL